MKKPITLPLQIKKTQKPFVIGIDTGVNTGLAVWNKELKQFQTIGSYAIHEALEILRLYDPLNAVVRVEDARLRKWIPSEKSLSQRVGRAKGAGSVSRDAKIWEDYLKDRGFDYEMVAPKNNKTKMSADYFKRLTGYQGKTNSHARDAAMLVINF